MYMVYIGAKGGLKMSLEYQLEGENFNKSRVKFNSIILDMDRK